MKKIITAALLLLFFAPIFAQDQNTWFIYVNQKKTLKGITISVDSVKAFFNVEVSYAEAFEGLPDFPDPKLFLVKVRNGKMDIVPTNLGENGFNFKDEKVEKIKKEVIGLLDKKDLEVTEPVDYMSEEMFFKILKR
ncbi:hypothetical protein A2645_00600 [Candidatus Nomurabacteria bacterium RIFCSPHIGHO2_01_FULL_39_9]|uniref:DUF5667 domain-containing protein n=1 Tax=Candidatus Nomurabacteria bacterium RIFCSPHIGHO2_01_FULL_39_9 TaxID=1801735 RepID=A0A1F6UWT5_9BACT|nr:MAG: hypothetical protein A2645_00600 [Candidatus Nomurabacteria bacterium RIFCSPHIGHO2_01_FULL_39_9]